MGRVLPGRLRDEHAAVVPLLRDVVVELAVVEREIGLEARAARQRRLRRRGRCGRFASTGRRQEEGREEEQASSGHGARSYCTLAYLAALRLAHRSEWRTLHCRSEHRCKQLVPWVQPQVSSTWRRRRKSSPVVSILWTPVCHRTGDRHGRMKIDTGRLPQASARLFPAPHLPQATDVGQESVDRGAARGCQRALDDAPSAALDLPAGHLDASSRTGGLGKSPC